ncbi:MAG TPA: signal peptidase I [Thermoanaerobaculia bacterium]|nr:signal peptidase I [Thermoanaerobaculia bacterium]
MIAQPLIVALVLAFAVRSVARLYAVPSMSMAPALLPGDRIVVTRLVTDTPARGDVIVFRHPIGGDLTVKRVIAIPGDLVDSDGGHVRIGGKALAEPYLAPGMTSDGIQALVVPSQHLFVLGDNRIDSYDSRHWGPLPDDLIVGRARVILWHAGPDHGPESRIFKWIE